jgi:hypothetical protein
MLNGLTVNLTRKVRSVFPMNLVQERSPGVVDLAIGPSGYSVVRMPIFELPLSAPYAVEGTTTFPHFDGAHPVMKQMWTVPNNMRLYLCVHITNALECAEQFLVAMDDDRKCWRLPVSNLYADCRLCPGRYSSSGNDIIQVCQRTWVQFQSSNWNADLYNDATLQRRNCTKAMFTFDVSNEKFIQRPAPKKWWDLCEKVATEFVTNYIVY